MKMFELNDKGEVSGKNRYYMDDVLSMFPVYGRYHLTIFVFVFLAYLSHSMGSHDFIFAADIVSYRCKYSILECEVGTHNGTSSIEDNVCYARLSLDNGTSCVSSPDAKVVPCTEWVYDIPNSFVAEFRLGCEEWKRTLVGTAHNVGTLVGLLFVGPFSDKFGRKTAIIITGVAGGIIGLAKSCLRSYWMYIALEFLGAAIGDTCSPTFMLALEAVSAKDRILFTTIIHFGLESGGILFGCLAWYISYWRNLLRVIYAPALLFIFYIFTIDESPRWLMVKGKKEEAVKILEKAAKRNKLALDKAILDNLSCKEESGTESYLRALNITFSSRTLLSRFLVALVWWITCTFVHHGILINSVLLDGNKYLNYILMMLVDVVGISVMGFILATFRRKNSLMFSFLGAAVLLLLQPFLPSDVPWLSLSFYLGGRFFMTMYFGMTYIITSELFPTSIRNTMHALCSSIGRIGSILAPQTPLLMTYWTGFPTLIFGGMSLLAALLTMTIPDDCNASLPDTVHETIDVELKN